MDMGGRYRGRCEDGSPAFRKRREGKNRKGLGIGSKERKGKGKEREGRDKDARIKKITSYGREEMEEMEMQ